MSEPPIPALKDSDPEEVSDKLSIAAAMWARGERHDALQWLRRAAESAADAEDDMRALELAKATSALSAQIGSIVPPAAAPAGAQAPPPPPSAPAAPPPSSGAVRVAPSASRTPAAKPATAPKSPAYPGAKLKPLPPLRPLGSAPSAPPRSRPPAPPPSSPAGPAGSASAGPSPAQPGARGAPPVEPWEDGETATAAVAPQASPAKHDPAPQHAPQHAPEDDEETRQIMVAAEPPAPTSSESTSQEHTPVRATPVQEMRDADEGDLRETMRREAAEITSEAGTAHDRATPLPVALPVAVGMRVRVRLEHGVVTVSPDADEDGGGDFVRAILVPASPDDDLRALFLKAR